MTWDPVAYLVKRFRRLSETFVLQEFLELRRQGPGPSPLCARASGRTGGPACACGASARGDVPARPPPQEVLGVCCSTKSSQVLEAASRVARKHAREAIAAWVYAVLVDRDRTAVTTPASFRHVRLPSLKAG